MKTFNLTNIFLAIAMLPLLLAGSLKGQPTASMTVDYYSQQVLEAWANAPLDPVGAQQKLAKLIPNQVFIPNNLFSPVTTEAARFYLLCRKYSPNPRAGAKGILALLDQADTIHGFTARLLREAAAGDAAASGDLDSWKRLKQTSPPPAHYLVLGPLGDFADDQHEVIFPPEQLGIDLKREVKGTYGNIRWRRLIRPWNLNTINPARNLKKDEGAYYFLLQVNNENERSAWVVIEPEGSFQAWINGTKAASMHSPQRDIPRQVILPIRLAKGWNRILIKTTDAEEFTFGLRIVDRQGRELTDLQEEKGLALHPLPKPAPTIKEINFHTTTNLLAAPSGIPDNQHGPWRNLLLCHVLMHQGLSSLGLAHASLFCKDGQPELPRTWQALFASRQLRAWHLPTDYCRNKSRPLLEDLAKGKDAAALRAGLELVELLLDDDQGEKALTRLKGMLDQHPSLFILLEKQYQAYARLRWGAELHMLRQRLRQIAPFRTEYPSSDALRAHHLGDTRHAYKLLRAAHLIDQADTIILSRLRRYALDLGNLKDAARWLELEKQLTPHDASLISLQAQLAEFSGNRKQAIDLLSKLCVIQPEDSEWTWRLAQLHDPAQALTIYRKLLKDVDPSRHRIRRLVAELENRKWGAELATYRTDIAAVIKNFKMKERYRQSSSTLVVDHMVNRVFQDGPWYSEIHQLRRINDLQGVDDYGEVYPQGEPVILRAWHPDGRVSEPISVGGSFEIPDLEPGCFIEEMSRLSYRHPPRGSQEVTDFWFSRFDEDFLWTRLIVIMPKNFDRGGFRRSGRLDPPQVEEQGNMVIYTWDHQDMPRVKREPLMPMDEELLPWTVYGEDRPAGEINRELRERFLLGIKGSVEIKEALLKICSGPMSDIDRIKAIHSFTQEHIPDRQGANDPTSILLKREGERWFLEAAMLKMSGIPMRFAYIHPKPPGTDTDHPPLFQDISQWSSWFNLPALKLYPRNRKAIWLVAGMPRHMPLGMIHEQLNNAPVLMLDKGGPTLDFLPHAEPIHMAQFICTGKITLLDQLEAEGIFKLTFPGGAGYSLKAAFARFTSDQRQRFVSGRLVAPFFRGAALRKVELKGLNDKNAPLQIQIKLHYRHFLQHESGKPAIPLGISPVELGRLAAGPDRIWPLVFPNHQLDRWKITIDPGKHWQIAELPPSMMQQYEFITWDMRFHQTGNLLHITRNLIMEPGRLAPEKYKHLITVCRKIDEAENRKIILLPRRTKK